jgi:hypothetical protein
MRMTLWRAMLDAEFNSRYWRAVADKYSQWDLWLRIFLTLAASGTVAAWGVWVEVPSLWKTLSGIAAAASIVSPLLAFGKKAEVAAVHAGTWAELRIRSGDLWDAYETKGETKALVDEHGKLRKIFTDLEREEPKLKILGDKRLAERCQAEVLREKGLQRAGVSRQPAGTAGKTGAVASTGSAAH